MNRTAGGESEDSNLGILVFIVFIHVKAVTAFDFVTFFLAAVPLFIFQSFREVVYQQTVKIK